MSFQLILLLFAAACSSVPDFKPSIPVEKAANFQEALDVCASYQVKVKGMASAKVVDIVPWLRCLETVFQTFPEGLQNRHLAVLYRALQIRHDRVAAPFDFIKDPLRLNQLVLHALVMVKNPSVAVSEDDYHYAQKELPRYADYLEERGHFQGAKSRTSQVSEELGPLNQDLEDALDLGAGHGSNQGGPPRYKAGAPSVRLRLSEAQKGYCSRYRAHLAKLSNLKDLAEYKDILAQQAMDDPSQLQRVQKRVDSLKTECFEIRRQLLVELKTLKAGRTWFGNGACFP